MTVKECLICNLGFDDIDRCPVCGSVLLSIKCMKKLDMHSDLGCKVISGAGHRRRSVLL